MAKVLIATIYSPDPVLVAATQLGPNRLILLMDDKPDKTQQQNFDLIKNSLGRVVDVKEVRTDVYDIVSVARKCVEIIDLQPKDDEIFVNITAGRKTKALGLLFAAYARSSRVSKIAYNPEEDKSSVVYLPKMSFKFTESQKTVLDVISSSPDNISLAEMSEKCGLSRAMFYRNIDDLRDSGFITTDGGLRLTDAGKIGRL
ncbi:MAG: CRISPR locus-related DNA-binding protein [DPANN group archaeon]|nr:CRISPR locus-related DNA-binding protein [DPANN group archaeon]